MKETSRSLQPILLGAGNRGARLAWLAVHFLFFRPSPIPFHPWRRMLLRLFGARISPSAVVYPSTRVWAPWNLEMADGSCLARGVDCYCVAKVTLHENALVSQYAYLCTASHDHSKVSFPLVAAPIEIQANAWVCASCFVGPGICVGEGAIVGAASAVFRDVDAWQIVGGNPARPIGRRDPPK